MKTTQENGHLILIVDDDPNICAVLQGLLVRKGFSAATASDVDQAEQIIGKEKISCVITDLQMPGRSGMDLISLCRREKPGMPVIMITAYGDVDTAVQAMRAGAYDFITKPFDETELLNVVRKALNEEAGNRELVSTFFEESNEPFPGFVGASLAIKEIVKTIKKIGPTDSTVLVTGETGVGKELVARALHLTSRRSRKPFIKVNCAAIPETLVESELFGHEKGAFTGAVVSKPGRFELADGGTLFLDEIGDVPLHVQVKLLTVLQDHAFERVGGISTLNVDLRIVAATNRELPEDIKEGRFRSDLFYRLNVVPIHVPPLRERIEDMDIQTRYFLGKFAARHDRQDISLSPEVIAAFAAYQWPGNVRELENVVERMVLLSENDILGPELLPPEMGFTEQPVSDRGVLLETVESLSSAAEKQMIADALERTGSNRTRAAQLLGISRRTIQKKIIKYGL
ncbi:sigma-54 dependent transcriptional regulator [bacterium]|nr:sigma-54 dependent transcriptional regulator [bacterium]